jgi:hypothetical protein
MPLDTRASGYHGEFDIDKAPVLAAGLSNVKGFLSRADGKAAARRRDSRAWRSFGAS